MGSEKTDGGDEKFEFNSTASFLHPTENQDDKESTLGKLNSIFIRFDEGKYMKILVKLFSNLKTLEKQKRVEPFFSNTLSLLVQLYIGRI